MRVGRALARDLFGKRDGVFEREETAGWWGGLVCEGGFGAGCFESRLNTNEDRSGFSSRSVPSHVSKEVCPSVWRRFEDVSGVSLTKCESCWERTVASSRL